jgi:CubicO group peptidase (beta-lactamase class C family)
MPVRPAFRRHRRLRAAALLGMAVLATAACTQPASPKSPGDTSTSATPSSAPSGAASPNTITDASVAAVVDGKLDKIVADEMAATGVPGVAVAIIHRDKVVAAMGYGVRKVGDPAAVDPNTVFQLASLSKPVSATALSRLVERHTFAWDDPVHQVNPDLQFDDPYVTDHVTFADLYSHRSGLPGDASARHADFIARPDRADLHVKVNGAWSPAFTRMPDAQAPAGGISASVTDVARWVRLQLHSGSIDGTTVLAPDSLTAMHTPHIVRNPPASPTSLGSFYGLGLGIDVDQFGFLRWSHSGAFSVGAATTAVMLPQHDFGVVVLTNAAPIGAAEAIADTVIDDVVRGTRTQDWHAVWAGRFAALFAENPDLATPPPAPAPALQPAAYVGTYTNPYWGDVAIQADPQGALTMVRGPSRATNPLTHWDGNAFAYVPSPEVPNFRTRLTFTVAGDRATALDLGGPPGAGVLQRVS